MHVHVISAEGEAKFWLEPDIALSRNYNFSPKELNRIESIIEAHYHELASAWQQHFGC